MTEAGTSDPIEGGWISVDGNFTVLDSDRFGTYLVNIPPGTHRVSFRHYFSNPVFVQVTMYAKWRVNLTMEDKATSLMEL